MTLYRYGPRFESALGFASASHFGQHRKGNGAPYITHPLAVASIVGCYGGDEDQAIAALLHDVMEDCGVPREAIASRYGERVASIVEACTDSTARPKPPWRERKETHVSKVRTLPADHKLVVAADKLHNAQSIVRDRQRPSVGEEVWKRFSASRPEVLWYYRAMHDALADSWEHELLDELDETVQLLGR
jgi:(p)ppGpp synthase/HD superfamily hydrolase